MFQYAKIIEQILGQLESLMGGQPVTVNIGPESIDVAGTKFEVSESVTIKKV